MRWYYECHITFDGPDPGPLPPPWKFSRVDGDPVLGHGVKSYLTRQARVLTRKQELIDEMMVLSGMLKEIGCRVLRRKIELVTYDERVKP
jgi:hypothetical protein